MDVVSCLRWSLGIGVCMCNVSLCGVLLCVVRLVSYVFNVVFISLSLFGLVSL